MILPALVVAAFSVQSASADLCSALPDVCLTAPATPVDMATLGTDTIPRPNGNDRILDPSDANTALFYALDDAILPSIDIHSPYMGDMAARWHIFTLSDDTVNSLRVAAGGLLAAYKGFADGALAEKSRVEEAFARYDASMSDTMGSMYESGEASASVDSLENYNIGAKADFYRLLVANVLMTLGHRTEFSTPLLGKLRELVGLSASASERGVLTEALQDFVILLEVGVASVEDIEYILVPAYLFMGLHVSSPRIAGMEETLGKLFVSMSRLFRCQFGVRRHVYDTRLKPTLTTIVGQAFGAHAEAGSIDDTWLNRFREDTAYINALAPRCNTGGPF